MNSAEPSSGYRFTPAQNGVVCIDGTRVTLDTVVGDFDTGATAEEIAHPSLAEVYSVIT